MKIMKGTILIIFMIIISGCSLAVETLDHYADRIHDILPSKEENEHGLTIFKPIEETPAESFEKEMEKNNCLNENMSCEELGDFYLEQLGEEASFILDSPYWLEEPDGEEFIPIVSYLVDGDNLYNPITEVEDAYYYNYEDFIHDTETHQEIWNKVFAIIPEEDRSMLGAIMFYTDGEANELGAVEPLYDDPKKWMLNIDINDIYDDYVFINTIVHEFGHLLTLNDAQIHTITDPDMMEEDEGLYVMLALTCSYYFTDYGCSKKDSYINEFYEEYWFGKIENEWLLVDLENEVDTYAFYDRHDDQFINDYAATSIYEDMSESWTYFVFSDRIEDPTENWERKINFFYNYPELVEIRAKVLKNLVENIDLYNIGLYDYEG
jgi:hypothetical protein